MSVKDDTNKVKKNIRSIYQRREAAVLAESINFAAIILNYFQSVQLTGTGSHGQFWMNQTEAAARQFFVIPFKQGSTLGIRIAHGIDYGKFLELANDRQNEAIRPLIRRFFTRYHSAIKKIYSDTP